jgi:hypothetical protein
MFFDGPFILSRSSKHQPRSSNIPKKKDIMFSNLSTKDLAIVACILDEEEENSTFL